MRLYTHLSLGFPHPRFFIAPLTITAIILASFFLAACGGGETAATQVPTPVPATLVPPATDSPEPATAVPAQTAPPAATGSPGAGAATSVSPTALPTVPPTAATAGPTVAPTEVLASNAVRVLQRSCPEDFRQVLLDYDGEAEFDAEIVRQLSGEFTGLRPDCLEEGWDPEIPDEPEVCLTTDDLSSSLSYKKNPRSALTYLHPTMREVTDRFGEVIRLQVHFTRIPLLSMVPSDLLRVPLRPGESVGGCWLYEGPPEGGGKWTQSVIIYTSIHPDVGLMSRDRRGHSLNVILPNSFPACDLLLQQAVSARLEAGEVPDASAVMDLVEEVRTQAGGACDREKPWSWMYVPPMDGGAGGCPGSPLTGLQDNGDFVLNWGEHHFDGYGNSACWIRSPEGEWVGYLRE